MDLFKWKLRGIPRRRETKNSYTLLKKIFAVGIQEKARF